MTECLLSVSRTLSAPIDEVWAMTSSFGAIAAWMPAVAKVTQTGVGIGAIRMVTTGFGVSEEQLANIDADRHSIRYTVKAAGMDILEGCVGGTTLTEQADGRTRIDWVVESERKIDLSALEGPLSQFFESGISGLAAFLKVDVE